MKSHRVTGALIAGLAVVGLVLAATACGRSASGAQGDGVTVTDVWSRATAAQATTGVVYFTVESANDDEIVAAGVPADIAASAQIHQTTTSVAGDSSSGGMMGMHKVSSIALPAGQEVAFEPGGNHVMLIDLAGPLEDGQTFDVTLNFRTAPPMTVTATVRS